MALHGKSTAVWNSLLADICHFTDTSISSVISRLTCLTFILTFYVS